MALMTSLAIDMDLHNGEPRFGPPTYHDKIGAMEQRMDASKKVAANKIN